MLGGRIGWTLILCLLPIWSWAQVPGGADFDGDGRVDQDDFVALVEAYGSNLAAFDLNGNGVVDFQDFMLFVSAFDPRLESGVVQVKETVGRVAIWKLLELGS